MKYVVVVVVLALLGAAEVHRPGTKTLNCCMHVTVDAMGQPAASVALHTQQHSQQQR